MAKKGYRFIPMHIDRVLAGYISPEINGRGYFVYKPEFQPERAEEKDYDFFEDYQPSREDAVEKIKEMYLDEKRHTDKTD